MFFEKNISFIKQEGIQRSARIQWPRENLFRKTTWDKLQDRKEYYTCHELTEESDPGHIGLLQKQKKKLTRHQHNRPT